MVLPDELFDKVLEEALVFERHERDERAVAAHQPVPPGGDPWPAAQPPSHDLPSRLVCGGGVRAAACSPGLMACLPGCWS